MLSVVKDNGLLNKFVYMKKKLVTQSYTTDCINIKKNLISTMYLNKMIAIDVTDTNYVMHRRISRWLTSKRKERHTLLVRQGYKDYIVP